VHRAVPFPRDAIDLDTLVEDGRGACYLLDQTDPRVKQALEDIAASVVSAGQDKVFLCYFSRVTSDHV
jgi:hypothetical protein